jgi:hypothetical protein
MAMNVCIPREQRQRRFRLRRATGLTALAWLFCAVSALAINPTKPVEIVTPEEVYERERIMPDIVQIRVREGEVRSFQTRTILFRNGERIFEQKLAPPFQRSEAERDGDQPGPVLTATIPAVPDALRQQVKPGVYAHKVEVTAQIEEGVPPLEVSAWVRWQTDGERVEILTIERYSALTEEVEAAVGPDGKRTLVLRGGDIRLEAPGEPQLERFGTQVGGDEGVLPERPPTLNEQELRRSLDERNED